MRNSILRFAFAWLLAVNHFEQGLVIILTLIPLLAWRKKLPLSAALWPLGVGFAVGKISLETYFAVSAFHIRFTRVDYFFHNAREIITFDGVRPVSLYSFMNVFWLFALPALTWARKNRPPLFRRLALLLLADMAIAGFLTFDKMRVFALISWPVLLVLVLETCGKAPRRQVPTADPCLLLPEPFATQGAGLENNIRLPAALRHSVHLGHARVEQFPGWTLRLAAADVAVQMTDIRYAYRQFSSPPDFAVAAFSHAASAVEMIARKAQAILHGHR